MGATESLLYDDDDAASITTIRPQRANVTESSPSSSIPSSNNIHKTRPRRTNQNGEATGRMNQQQQQQQQQQKVQRRRAPVSHAKPIKRMEGLVLGCPKTGKRTLLSRLKGVDPFAMTEEMKNSVNGNANDSNDQEKKEANPSIIIQYKPPSESPTWDRIKLRIRYANNDIVQKENNTRIDFVVVLISPKDSRETTQSCLEGVLAMYLDRSGYRHRKAAGADDDDDKRERDTHSSSDRSTGSMQPFCIAILFNFRDLEKEEKYPAASASRTDLERLVDQTLRSRNVPENKVVVELLETSLLNCYGLDGLHRFIYRTYLQRSQTDIEWQLDVVRNQIQLTNNNNENDKNNNHQADDNNAKAKSMAYDEFLKEIAPKETVQSSQHQSQHSIDSPTKDRQQQKQPGPRRIMKQPQTLRMGKDALEAFLASSSDEEDTNENTKTKAPVSKPVGNNGFSSDDSSDDDSDDDFFYDESGNRRHHTIVQNQKSNPATTAAASRGGDGDQNEALDDNADDPSSEEKVVREVRSSAKALNDNADDSSSSDEEESIQEVQSPPKALDGNADHSSTSEVDNEEEVFREDNSPPKALSANPKQIEKTELVDEEVTNKACIASNGTEKKDEIDDDAPKDGSNHEQDVNRDGNNNGGNAREADDETDAVAAPDIANDNDTDDEGFNDNSCQEKIRKANDETADVNSNRDGFVDKDKTDGDKIVNGENDDDIDIAPTLPLNTDDGSDDSNMIVSTSVVEKAVQDNDDSGDDYIISSNSVIGRVVQDNDNDDDDDDDGFMISSTPVVKNDAQDDDDDDDFMIGSTPAGENVVEHNDDDDEDGYMISSTPPVKNVAQDENEDKDNDDDDDDGDNGYMISSTPAVGKVVEDDDDDDKFMIGNMLANEDDEMKEDDDSIGFVQSSPIEDGDETNTEAFSPTRLPKNQSIERSYSGSTVENEGKKVDSSSKIDEINSTSQQEPESQSALAATQQRASNSNPPPQPSTKPVASGGISQAAIAAIAAAQQEAEAMMRQQQQQRQGQQYSQIPSPTTTKERKSKKKKKDEKKKKKKKKTKGTDDE